MLWLNGRRETQHQQYVHDAAAKRARSQTVAAAALQQLRRATDEKMYSPRVLGTGDISRTRYVEPTSQPSDQFCYLRR